jgi:hypothetical protein
MAGATLACLLSFILNGQRSAILAVSADLAVGLFAVIAAKGTKAILVLAQDNRPDMFRPSDHRGSDSEHAFVLAV